MPWWAWLILGFFLLAGEMFAPGGFYLLFPGLAAIIVGLLGMGGLDGPEWVQWLLFTVFSIAALTTVRGRLAKSFRGSAVEIDDSLIVALALAALAIYTIFRGAVVVPQQNAYVVERLGKYANTMSAGFHILIPFFDRVAYRHSLKEHAIDIPEQTCITRDNVQVGIDGVTYLKVLDAQRASYGIGDFIFAITQLAQTTLRSEIGKIELDRMSVPTTRFSRNHGYLSRLIRSHKVPRPGGGIGTRVSVGAAPQWRRRQYGARHESCPRRIGPRHGLRAPLTRLAAPPGPCPAASTRRSSAGRAAPTTEASRPPALGMALANVVWRSAS